MEIVEYVGSFLNENKGLVIASLAGLTSAGIMYLKSPYEKFDYPVSLDKQSIEAEANNGEFLGMRTGPNLEYEWIHYQEAYDTAQKIGSAFISLGIQPGDEGFVGIFCPNRPEWVICKEACSMYSLVYIPLYDTLGPEACTYVINQTSMKIVVCDSMQRANMLLKNATQSPDLRYILVLNGYHGDDLGEAIKRNVKIISYEEMKFLGNKRLLDPIPPKPSSVACVCYTSGTTGNPKGVLLTHENLIANTAAFTKMIPASLNVTTKDTHISYLPLAHMFEGVVQLLMIQHGGRIGFFRGDIRQLTDDMQALKPTIFPTVPRLLNRIYDKVLLGVQDSKLKSFLFKLALRKKTELLKQAIFTRDSVWDKLIFKKIQSMLGGHVRVSIVGSAPLSPAVLTFTRVALGCLVFEGYGQTEATAGATVTLPHEAETGHVGPPILCNKIKLVDVPEMDYYAKDGKGEVCIQGTNVMKGYYKEPEKTKEVLEDGWLHTGDIGMWMPNGSLKIIDRRKHIFKLAQGEYLAPEKIEGVYVRSPLIAQAFVDGDSLQTYAVGVVVPDPEVIPKWAKEKLGLSGTMEELCKKETLKKAILADLTKLGNEAGLKSFEQVKIITLFPELFSVENGLLTPTFKSKRPALRKFFSMQIEAMYKA
ncbi:hypothetical protein LSH36_67g01021 [Paralvinella palmiformis]|uniref:Long-chain-fatty-acid--CoA ligase n=1 Tax=Paralvinella palmiformis TaxID=53620 RepID=A0AAD9K3T0_9ANNE|nr:hypothetical protein LSH36_67g01021 [Paralvinella palmiformis]